MDRLKPFGFVNTDWPGLDELFCFRSNGIVTYRDPFIYATDRQVLERRIQAWLRLPPATAREEFKDSARNKTGPALRVPFDPAAVQVVSYRPLDRRFLYNKPEYVDRPRSDLADLWGIENVALMALEDGTGAGPAIWCHGLIPDQHAFSGRGGWIFPLRNHAAESAGHLFRDGVLDGLSAVYGFVVAPQSVFDAILALLSASSYATRFAHDLEDDFPHVPFPADPAVFLNAAAVGSRLRALETFGADPSEEFRVARLLGNAGNATLAVPAPARAFVAQGGGGYLILLADQSLRVGNISERAWRFSVSDYPVLYRWLRARNGEAVTARLQREILDVIARIEEILSLSDQADDLLRQSIEAPIRCAQLGLPTRSEGRWMVEGQDESN